MSKDEDTQVEETPLEQSEESLKDLEAEGVADTEAETETVGETAPGAEGRVPGALRRHWVAALLAVLLVASAGAAGGVYWWLYRPDQQTDAQVAKQVTDAAKDGTVALLSYAPDTLDKDLANAKSHLTGEFLKYYSQFTDQIVAPAAKKKGVKTEANVARAAVSELEPGRAVVLVFVNQVTTSKDRPDPALATSSVMVTLVKDQDGWKISEFNPV